MRAPYMHAKRHVCVKTLCNTVVILCIAAAYLRLHVILQVDAGGVGLHEGCDEGGKSGAAAAVVVDSGAAGGSAGGGAAADLNYIYGSHYSTPAYTVHFLVRLIPECLLRLHCGRFDCTHRIFRSMQGAWAGKYDPLAMPLLSLLAVPVLQLVLLCSLLLLRLSPATLRSFVFVCFFLHAKLRGCVRVVVRFLGAYSGQSTFVELTPEFYLYDTSFLCNRLAIRLTPKPAGTPLFAPAAAEDSTAAAAAGNASRGRADGPAATASGAVAAAAETLGDVELPVWCKGDPALLLLMHRAALESSSCSSSLHRWIDLIFGYKQTGQVTTKGILTESRLTMSRFRA